LSFLEKAYIFWQRWDRLIIAGLSTLCWAALFFLFLYWTTYFTLGNPMVPNWFDALSFFVVYALPFAALATIACVWICYLKKSPLMIYCNLIPIIIVVIIIPIFLLIFTFVEYLL